VVLPAPLGPQMATTPGWNAHSPSAWFLMFLSSTLVIRKAGD